MVFYLRLSSNGIIQRTTLEYFRELKRRNLRRAVEIMEVLMEEVSLE